MKINQALFSTQIPKPKSLMDQSIHHPFLLQFPQMSSSTTHPLRVQTLSESPLTQVPSQFIQSPHNRPTTTATTTLPTLDLHNCTLSDLASLCRNWGAFHLTNHSIPTQLLTQTRSLSHHFFTNTPLDYKLSFSCDPNSPASQGYGSKMLANDDDKEANTVLDWRDYFDHHTFPVSRRDPTKWPAFDKRYGGVVSEYADRMMGLAKRLLGLICESLGLGSECVEEFVGREFWQNITVSFYPPCPQPELTLGLQAHSDMGVVTLLVQDDVGGLEVLKEGEWVRVEPVEDGIVVLLADQLEILTNGECKSAVHRAVVNSNRARLSVATFHDPPKDVKISPLPSLISESCPARFREVVYGDYVKSWYTKGPEGKRNIDALKIDP